VALAALGINAAIFTTVFWMFNFLTYGTTAAVARLRGAGRPQDAASYALQALWLAVGCGALVAAVLLLAGPAILALMGASGAVTAPALAYLRIRGLASVAVLVVAVGHGAFRGLKDTRTPLVVALAANGVNALLGYLLIYPAGLGVAGAAWAALVAQTGAALAFLVLGRRAFPLGRLRLDLMAMRALVRVSRDLFLRTAALLTGLTLTTAVAARMGVATIAAHQIARELWTMLAFVLDGFAIAAQAMVATALGAGLPRLAIADASRLLRYGIGFGAVFSAGYYLLGPVLPRLFTGDPAVLAGVGQVWAIVALLQPVGGVVFVLDGVLMGAADFRFLLWSTAAAALLALAPLALASLALGWGLRGLWLGMSAMMAVRLATTVWRLRTGSWARPGAVGPVPRPS
jgi:putative MATE family efflux protein